MVRPDGDIGSSFMGCLPKQPLGVEEHDPGSNHDLAHGADGIGQVLLADPCHELRAGRALERVPQ